MATLETVYENNKFTVLVAEKGQFFVDVKGGTGLRPAGLREITRLEAQQLLREYILKELMSGKVNSTGGEENRQAEQTEDSQGQTNPDCLGLTHDQGALIRRVGHHVQDD